METIELMTQVISHPFLVQFYAKFDGRWEEFNRTIDCPLHRVRKDGSRHFCFAPDLVLHEIPPSMLSCGQWMCCSHVCDYKKQCFSNELKEHGKWYEEPVRCFAQEYLAKSNTVSWNTVDISERGQDDGARLSVSPGKADPEDGEQFLQANGEYQTAGGVQRWHFSCQIDSFNLP